MATKKEDVSAEEMALSYSGPAIVSNKFYIAVGPTGVRVTFAEGQNGAFHFRSAIMLSFQDAIALKDILGELLIPIEAQIASAGVAEADASQNG